VAQEGSYSEAQFSIGTGPLAPCAAGAIPATSPSWPSDLASGGTPDSTDKVTVLDIVSFVAPLRRLDSSPGDPEFSPRWDLVPGRGFLGDWINIGDLTALLAGPSGYPAMFAGARAFSGPACSGL